MKEIDIYFRNKCADNRESLRYYYFIEQSDNSILLNKKYPVDILE